MKLTSFKDVRDYALAPVIKEINTLIAEGNAKPRVLEAGCGNCINLMLLHKEFGEHIELVGIDITSQRLKVAQTYWGDKLGSAKIMVDSVLELKSAEDSSFDLVFSVHCLEQLPYDVDQAVKMMKRVSRNRIVFVEPVWENHNISQKLYTLYADHVRTLWPAVLSNDLKVIDTYAAELMANPLNRSGIIVAQKTVPDAAR
ncbi:MAG: class I SAM-dependent methyltransferase [Pseudomonadota bacterium]